MIIPSSVTSIGDNAFGMTSLKTVVFLGDAPEAGIDVFVPKDPGDVAASTSTMGARSASFGSVGVSGSRSYLDDMRVVRLSTTSGWGDTWGDVRVFLDNARAIAVTKPAIRGITMVGGTLTAAKGSWSGYPAPTFTYQWYACTKAVTAARTTVPSTCKKITRATRSTFKLTSAQRGKYVAVLVKGTSLRTTATTWLSKTTTSIGVRATATVKPAVTGTSTVGKTLTAAKGTWTGYPTPTFTYQWYACTRAVTIALTNVPSTCVRISGATKSTFKLTSTQRGKYVAVLVKGTSLRTTATTWLSKTTAKVK